MKNTVISILFAGLGNKFASLVSGHTLSKRLNKNLHIFNLNDKWQTLDYRLIFDFKCEYTEVINIEQVDEIVDLSIPAFSRAKFNFKRNCFEISQIEKANSLDSFIFLSHRPIHLSDDDIINFLKDFNIKLDLKKEIDSFIKINDLNKNVYGLHVRASDVPFRNLNIEFAENFIRKNKDKRIFLCTDEKNVEQKLCTYDNVFVRKKTNYVQKIKDTDPWDTLYMDEKYKIPNSNSIRHSDCEIESFIDMILLSRTNIIDSSRHIGTRSTFCDWASKFSNIDVI